MLFLFQKIKVEQIWRGKHKFCKRQIRGNKYADTTIIFNGNNQHNIEHNNKLDRMLFSESFDLPMRTIIINRRVNMENRKQKIISFQNALA